MESIDKTEEVKLDSEEESDNVKAKDEDKDLQSDKGEVLPDTKVEAKVDDLKETKDKKDTKEKEDTKEDIPPPVPEKNAVEKATGDDVEEEGPPKPKRPVDPVERLKNELRLAFPEASDNLITSVLIASQGNLEYAFPALLHYFDPSTPVDIPATPVQGPPRGTVAAGAKYPSLNEDEVLARQLQKQFEEEDKRARRERRRERQQPQQQQHGYDDDLVDEFEQIKETFTQGLEDAKSTINGWVLGLSKKFEELSGDEPPQQSKPLFGAFGGQDRPQHERPQRTQNRARFDDDPVTYSEQHLPLIRMNNNEDATKKAEPKKWQPLDANSDKFQVDLDDD